MATDVHPAGPVGPLLVATGATGPSVAFTEHAGVDPATGRLLMFLRVAQIDGEPAAPPPRLLLTAGANPPVDVSAAPMPVHDEQGTLVALATRTDEPDALSLVEVEILQPGRPWRLQIVNRDGADHHYVWVVADTDDGTRRPWLDLPVATLAFQAVPGAAVPPRDVPVANHGTAPLTLADPDGAPLGAGFTLLAVTPRPIGANRTGTARIGFTAPAEPVDLAIEHIFASNDPGAGTVTGHRNQLTVTGVVQGAPRWTPGDVLMLVGSALGRLDPGTGRPVPVSTDTAGAVDVAVDPTTGDALLLGAASVTRVNRFTGAQAPVPGLAAVTAPVALAVDKDGTVVVLDGTAVVRVKPDGTSAVTQTGEPGPLRDMALEASGDAVVLRSGSFFGGGDPKVVRITRSGSVTTLVTGGLLNGPSGGPEAIAVLRDETVLTIRRGQEAGGGMVFSFGVLIKVDPGSGQPRIYTDLNDLREPAALAVAADGTILVSGSLGLFAVGPETPTLTRLSTVANARVAVVPPQAD